MKELTIEQKAKAYDKALERAKEWSETKNGYYMPKELCEELFPELKESDERIRNDIILYIGARNDISLDTHNKWLSWLEKQGETFTKKDVNDAYLKGVADTKNEIEKQYEANYQIRKDIATFIFNYRGDIKDRAKWMDYLGIKISFVEKQGESIKIEKGKNYLCTKTHKYAGLEWTAGIKYYSPEDYSLVNQGCTCYCPEYSKEEHNNFFKEVEYSGCLEEDEIEPKFNIGDTIVKKHNSDIHRFGPFTITDITDGKYWYNDRIICDVTEQDEWEIYEPVGYTPAEWSEADESYYDSALWHIKNSSGKEGIVYNWLKSLKNRVQPKR